uniref:Acyltransferase C-terminal domain-containing protein n=1 Tax=Setaria digitata TaxID=48799 RepID=A0A915Q390_9BILA
MHDNSSGMNAHLFAQKRFSLIVSLSCGKRVSKRSREKRKVVYEKTRPPVKYVLDVTIAYPHKMPLSLFTLSFGTREPCDIGVHYKIYDARDVPFEDDEKLRDWLYSVYQYKDNILDRYYKEGVFVRGEEGTRVYFPWWRIVGQISKYPGENVNREMLYISTTAFYLHPFQ